MSSKHEDKNDRRDVAQYGRRDYDYRFEVLEKAADQAWETAGEMTIVKEKITQLESGLKAVNAALEKGLQAVNDEVAGLRKTLIGFAFSIAGSAIVFAIGVFALVGR